jgi:hypothetical protein
MLIIFAKQATGFELAKLPLPKVLRRVGGRVIKTHRQLG